LPAKPDRKFRIVHPSLRSLSVENVDSGTSPGSAPVTAQKADRSGYGPGPTIRSLRGVNSGPSSPARAHVKLAHVRKITFGDRRLTGLRNSHLNHRWRWSGTGFSFAQKGSPSDRFSAGWQVDDGSWRGILWQVGSCSNVSLRARLRQFPSFLHNAFCERWMDTRKRQPYNNSAFALFFARVMTTEC